MAAKIAPIRVVLALFALVELTAAVAFSQGIDAQVRVELLEERGHRGQVHAGGAARDGQKALDHGNVVIWLSPASQAPGPQVRPGHFRMEQKNKSFHPHLLVVPLGSTVEFPNLDPFFHNVFSQFNGKRFDLGLYEAGSTRVVHFDHEGVSYIFCNIHSQMAAVIVTLRTPYFAVGTRSEPLEVHDVPPGDYQMHVWAEGADARQLQDLARRVHLGATQRDLGTIQVFVTSSLSDHKNKFGQDYRQEPETTY